MFRGLLCYFIVFSCSIFGFPQSSSPCRRDDNKCLASLAQRLYAASFEGSHEYTLDPLFKKLIEVKLPSVVFTLIDTTTTGFKSCQVRNVSISSDKTLTHVALFCPRFEMFGHYDANGTLGPVPFLGNGPYTLDARDYLVDLDVKFETTVRDGKIYSKIIDFDVEAQLKGAMDFKLENLFNGHKVLSAATQKFIDENSVLVTNILQKPVFIANLKKMVAIFNKSMENVPVDGLIA